MLIDAGKDKNAVTKRAGVLRTASNLSIKLIGTRDVSISVLAASCCIAPLMYVCPHALAR
eukprot:2255762-Pyramimonas_sp.AAC.3